MTPTRHFWHRFTPRFAVAGDTTEHTSETWKSIRLSSKLRPSMTSTPTPCRIVLLRHAEAAPALPGTSDATRDLTDAGVRQCSAIKPLLEQWADSLFICSPARRTVRTLTLATGKTPADAVVIIDNALYDGGPDAYMAAINNLDGGARSVVMIGHNPAISALGSILTGEAVALATASLAVIESGDWTAVRAGRGTLKNVYHTPPSRIIR